MILFIISTVNITLGGGIINLWSTVYRAVKDLCSDYFKKKSSPFRNPSSAPQTHPGPRKSPHFGFLGNASGAMVYRALLLNFLLMIVYGWVQWYWIRILSRNNVTFNTYHTKAVLIVGAVVTWWKHVQWENACLSLQLESPTDTPTLTVENMTDMFGLVKQ